LPFFLNGGSSAERYQAHEQPHTRFVRRPINELKRSGKTTFKHIFNGPPRKALQTFPARKARHARTWIFVAIDDPGKRKMLGKKNLRRGIVNCSSTNTVPKQNGRHTNTKPKKKSSRHKHRQSYYTSTGPILLHNNLCSHALPKAWACCKTSTLL